MVPTTAIMFRMAVLSVLLFVAACYDERRVADSIKPLTRAMTDVEWAADIPSMTILLQSRGDNLSEHFVPICSDV